MRLVAEERIQELQWVVFTSNPDRAAEAMNSAEYFTRGLENKSITIMDFKDGILPQFITDVKNYLEQLKAFDPDIIFTHYRHDLHQDHRLVNELTWNTFRNHYILEYEIQKYDGDLGNPNLFVSLDADTAETKVNALLDFFSTQAGKHWFDDETFYSLMRIRGLESVTRYAEAFYSRKTILL